ncbi:MAG TPA: PHP domain-containing protein [Solirubrobacteraceae bacterium]|nr:PHP domain-containing protein [Solirubrobacteraceae bacterium]
MSAPSFDLQSHSIHSDGALPPAEVVALAAAAGVELLALSDHDSVNGVDEALAAGEEQGVRMVPATEISALRSPDEDVHVLGYGVDHRDRGLLDWLEASRADRELRAERLAQRLEELGFEVDRSVIEKRRAAGKTVGRPHIAAGVLARAGNRQRLAEEGIDDVGPFIAAYLIPGAPGYLPRLTPTVEDAVSAIHDAGGVAVWAHPFWDLESPDEVLAEVDRFRACGLDGVETFYATHTREQTHLLHEHCSARGLLQTGSADFHGPDHKQFNAFRAFDLYGLEPVLGPIA